MAVAVCVRSLGKSFDRHVGGPAATFRGFVEGGWRRGKKAKKFWALRDVNFEVATGEMLGVVGHNGSGKTTLLRLLGGVMVPNEGSVETVGRVNGLLDLNAGMHQDLTGRENVLISGVLAGLGRNDVRMRFDDIVDFAELQEFIDSPVRTYSAGMKLRLGFSVAMHVRPDILLIDEVLAVGDLAFQMRCLERIRQFRKKGCSIILISHDMSQIAGTCDRAIWLDHGSVRAVGDPADIVASYRSALLTASARKLPQDIEDGTTYQGRILQAGKNRFGSLEGRLNDVVMLGLDGEQVSQIASGAALTIQAGVRASHKLPSSHFSVTITNAAGEVCFDVNTENDQTIVPGLTGTTLVELSLERLDLSTGNYSLSVGLWRSGWEYAYDYHVNAYDLEVVGTTPLQGILSPPRRWKLHSPKG